MSNATNAGVVVEIQGKEYEFQPLTVRDIEWLENWLKTRAIEVGRNSIPESATPDEADAMMRPIIAEANKINLFEGGFDQLFTIGGVSRMFWKMVLHRHPNVPLSTVMEWAANKELIQEIFAKTSIFTMKQVSENGDLKKGAQRQTRKH